VHEHDAAVAAAVAAVEPAAATATSEEQRAGDAISTEPAEVTHMEPQEPLLPPEQ
jgi:hypothetical protein